MFCALHAGTLYTILGFTTLAVLRIVSIGVNTGPQPQPTLAFDLTNRQVEKRCKTKRAPKLHQDRFSHGEPHQPTPSSSSRMAMWIYLRM